MFICDNNYDCPNSEDEKNCTYSFDELFECHISKSLINIKLVCNHIRDCDDGSDEMICSTLQKAHNFLILYKFI